MLCYLARIQRQILMIKNYRDYYFFRVGQLFLQQFSQLLKIVSRFYQTLCSDKNLYESFWFDSLFLFSPALFSFLHSLDLLLIVIVILNSDHDTLQIRFIHNFWFHFDLLMIIYFRSGLKFITIKKLQFHLINSG